MVWKTWKSCGILVILSKRLNKYFLYIYRSMYITHYTYVLLSTLISRVTTVLLRINAGGVHIIFNIFWGAFIYGRRLHEGGVYCKIQKSYNSMISTSMISSSSSIRKTALSASSTSESVIRSNGLGRSGSSNTSSCDINCSLPF